MNVRELAEHISVFIAELTDRQLERIYWSGARLWLDTGDDDLQITFVNPNRGDVQMPDTPPMGSWVWTELGSFTADEHPQDEEGDLIDEWPDLVEWTRYQLSDGALHFADHLEDAAMQKGIR